jgi:hypothetical protein
MLTWDELRQLRKTRDAAVEDFDFQKAKALDIQIKLLTQELTVRTTDQQRLANQCEYFTIREAVRSEASILHAEALEEISKIDVAFQDRFRALLTRHANDFSAQAIAFANDLELSSMRGVPDSAWLKREALLTARNGEFDAAQTKLDEADATRDAVILSRHQTVTETYEKLERHLEAQHNEQIRLNREKRNQRVREVHLKYDKEIDKLKKQLQIAAEKWQIQQNLEEEAEFFAPLGELEDIGLVVKKEARTPTPRRGIGNRASKVYPRFAPPTQTTPRAALRATASPIQRPRNVK